jgi:hypothetical protein
MLHYGQTITTYKESSTPRAPTKLKALESATCQNKGKSLLIRTWGRYTLAFIYLSCGKS